eukprot:10610394-Lingulodinium_polyedra.AAC.1
MCDQFGFCGARRSRGAPASAADLAIRSRRLCRLRESGLASVATEGSQRVLLATFLAPAVAAPRSASARR